MVGNALDGIFSKGISIENIFKCVDGVEKGIEYGVGSSEGEKFVLCISVGEED